MFNADITNQFRFELDADERILWSGQPRQGLMLQGYDLFMIPFSLMWGGFAIFWLVMSIHSGAPIFFSLFGVPFVLVGLYMIAGRFFYDSWSRKNTYYAITTQRVLIRHGGRVSNLSSFSLATLSETTLQEHPNGRGSILFNHALTFATQYNTRYHSSHHLPSFVQIENARQVYQILRRAQQDAVPSQQAR